MSRAIKWRLLCRLTNMKRWWRKSRSRRISTCTIRLKRRMTERGSRLRITGKTAHLPMGKYSVQLTK
jgi:hypothetical protein